MKREGRSWVPDVHWVIAADDARIWSLMATFHQVLSALTGRRQGRDHRELARKPSIREPPPHELSDLIVGHAPDTHFVGIVHRRSVDTRTERS